MYFRRLAGWCLDTPPENSSHTAKLYMPFSGGDPGSGAHAKQPVLFDQSAPHTEPVCIVWGLAYRLVTLVEADHGRITHSIRGFDASVQTAPDFIQRHPKLSLVAMFPFLVVCNHLAVQETNGHKPSSSTVFAGIEYQQLGPARVL